MLILVLVIVVLAFGPLGWSQSFEQTEEGPIHSFQRRALSRVYFSEGVATGDLNGDGLPDVVYGPYWFAGPDFRQRHEIYPPQSQPMHGYADHFFAWIHDFNGDGCNDVLVVGFPGTPAYVFENPGNWGTLRSDEPSHWKKHEVFDWVSNESPAFTDLTGDGQPELVCTRAGVFGYARPKPNSFEPWTFHRISGEVADERFGHGLGVGDVDGDRRQDVLTKDGWFQQPAQLDSGMWTFHPFPFASPGGAEMYAYDVNGDGLNDVITSIDAHGHGLVWWQQSRDAKGTISFRKHQIMGSRPSENPFGLHVSELHSVRLADLDGDGLQDIVTGKTYWSHHRQSPDWDAGPVVYWFKLQRTDAGVDWIPHLIDDQAGIGRQIVVADVSGNGLPDVIVGGMLGCHVLSHATQLAGGTTLTAAQPKPRRALTQDLTGAEAAAHMTVPQGFHVQLAAAEPDVHQPVAMALDHRGRLWIAEAYTYPKRAPEGEGLDKIIILEDTNLDGQFDSRKVFAEGLNLVSGLEVGFGGVWVGAAPYLLFIPDADGDDVPDGEPHILLDGFGYEDTHETLNAFNWGPDGWLYGCHGVFTHSRVGRPGTPDGDRIPLNAAIWRYHPTHHQFEVFAWGTSNPWGVDFDDHGQAFATACVIPHLFHVIQGGRYVRQAGQHFNPYTFEDLQAIADHLHYEGHIADHAWWGHEPAIRNDTADAGGGHAHCGAMIYLGDNWPDRYRNSIFMNNIHGNRVNHDRLARHGSGYVGRHGNDLLLANDRWFRGINLRAGPDGTVYLIDWYDKNACHRTNPEIWDRTNGRLYNIAFGVPHREQVDLDAMSDAELAKLALHRNDWFVRVARRLLQHRASQGRMDLATVTAEVEQLLTHADPTRVLRGMWLGHVTGLLDEPRLLSLLDHESPYVMAWSIQLLCETDHVADHVVEQLRRIAMDTKRDPLVRLYLAAALQRLDPEQRWPIAVELAQHAVDATDPNIPLMIWYAVEPLVIETPEKAMRFARACQIPRISEFIIRRAAFDGPALEAALSTFPELDSPEQQAMFLTQLLRGLEGRAAGSMPNGWMRVYKILANSQDAEIRDLADRLAVLFGDRQIFPQLRQVLADSSHTLDQRQRALEVLVSGRDPDASPALHAALQTAELQLPALRALAAYSASETPHILLESYTKWTPEVQREAIATLISRPSYAAELLKAVESGGIPRSDIHAFHVRQMTSLADESLRAHIERHWGRIGSSSHDERAAIENHKAMLPPNVLAQADTSHGRLLYDRHCAACHPLFGVGERVGPDLTGANRTDLDYLLENIIAPNTIVGKDYQLTIMQLADGRVVSGTVFEETDHTVSLKTLDGEIVVAQADIEDRRLSELSLMPSGLIDQFSPEEVRDLIAYLASPAQVPLRGPRASIDPSTGRVKGAYEGELMKVVQITGGSATRQNMQAFTADRWSGNQQLWWTGAQPGDRLTVELAVADSGSYDIQLALTRARDYGMVKLYWNDEPLGESMDLFHTPEVLTTGVVNLGRQTLAAGPHRLTIEIVGTNAEAIPAYMCGLDFVLLKPETSDDAD